MTVPTDELWDFLTNPENPEARANEAMLAFERRTGRQLGGQTMSVIERLFRLPDVAAEARLASENPATVYGRMENRKFALQLALASRAAQGIPGLPWDHLDKVNWEDVRRVLWPEED